MFVFCTGAWSYTRITVSSGSTPKWPSMPIPFWINEKGYTQIGNGSEFPAVLSSFQTWENVPTADIRFNYLGTTTTSSAGRDGMNIVSFADTSTPLGSSTIAVTFSFFRTAPGSGLIFDEADIVFNPALEFSTSAEENKFDIQSILTHEVGHLLGLDHSVLASSVMQPFGVASRLDLRTLMHDDIAGVSEIYPRAGASANFGQIRGTIQSGTIPVFGAHVVAVNSEGTPVVSTFSQPDGNYVLRLLPPDTYRVFAEPLDLPVRKEDIGGGTAGYYATIRTDFGTTFFGSVSNLRDATPIHVTANVAATANIQTLPKNATGLNLTRPAVAVRVPRGASGTLTVGGEEITAGVAVTASSPNVVLGTTTFSGSISTVASTSARLNLSISPTTPLGPKSIAVSRNADVSILAGALVITDPIPSGIAVAPSSGSTAGGTPVTVSGANFREGAQVYFGGLAATSVNVLNSGTILVNAPQNARGPVNVVVVNADGTWGFASRAFTYDTSPPVITRVTPLAGSPATVVTIEGENFDARLQDVSVQFSGVSAQVVSVTPALVTAIVPYGATTGPITVNVAGDRVTGPSFTVTGISSTNFAAARFDFIDASVAAGGTNVSFNSNDDGVTVVPLPFTFSLFQDVFLAGSPLSIATNGFLSFESLSSAEFQNGPLPGQVVERDSGTNGIIPASLIAPFWDDLIMKSDSTVTMRTFGFEPNRRFVVQWSNMSVLDEDGRDQNSSLTFEVVLFEGSNDIQFVYGNISGPRSDGSSATIGLQDLKRVTAVQTGFNESVLSPEYFKTYHFDNGGYLVQSPDATPPESPLISDEGALTANRTQLAASWASTDPETGIGEFQYAIGTTPGGSEVKPFASTTHNSILVTGLNLQPGTPYYFAVRAVNGSGVSSTTGVSDGIRFDPAYQPQIAIIPSATESTSEFTGLALLASAPMTIVLRAYDASGALVVGPGIRNPATISLAAGQQYARLLPELLGLPNFDGWIEAEASAAGLGIFAATGAWDMSSLDGSVARETSADFVLFHTGATAVLVNPSPRAASVSITSMTTPGAQTLSIPARGLVTLTLPSAVRIQSSEPLAAIEKSSRQRASAHNVAVPATTGQSNLVFAQGVVGGGYASTLMLANLGSTTQSVAVAFNSSTSAVVLPPNSSTRVSIPAPQSATSVIHTGAVTVTGSEPGTLIGVLDIENQSSLVSIEARPAATEFAFPHVANGNGLFTGLAIASGGNATRVTVEVYEPGGGPPKTNTVTLGANQHLSRLISEIVPGTATQLGGHIRVRADQPIWAWEIYGSGEVMASGPPL